jgi:predicted nucleic acid-binding protein
MVKSITDEMCKIFTEADTFFVDANVLIFLHNPLPESKKERAAAYSDFIQKVKKDGCGLYVSILNIQEFFHVTEKLYHELYCKTEAVNIKEFNIKSYRSLTSERNSLATKQQAFWSELKDFYKIVQEEIHHGDIDAFIAQYADHKYDPIDYIVTNHHKPVNIITNDRDFWNDEDIVTYTFM